MSKKNTEELAKEMIDHAKENNIPMKKRKKDRKK